MKQVLENVEARRVTDEIVRRGVPAHQRLRVIFETIGLEDLPMTQINADGGAFDWLSSEPDIYNDNDLVERYRG